MTMPTCRTCGRQMVIRDGKFGKFFACLDSAPGNNHGTLGIERPRSWALNVSLDVSDDGEVFDMLRDH